MRILGIDPGLRVTGFGVIDKTGQTLTYVTSGVIKTADADLPSRLHTIFEGISTLVRQHAPDQSAINQLAEKLETAAAGLKAATTADTPPTDGDPTPPRPV